MLSTPSETVSSIDIDSPNKQLGPSASLIAVMRNLAENPSSRMSHNFEWVTAVKNFLFPPDAQDSLQFRGCLAKFCDVSSRYARHSYRTSRNESSSGSNSTWRSLLTAVIETVRTRFPSLVMGSIRVQDLDYSFVSDDSYWQLLADVRNLVYIATDLMSDDE